jgi:predicted AAA+ superfamily ATPase
MKIIIQPRQSGKTTELIREVLKQDGYLLVHNFDMVKRIEQINKEMIGRVFSYSSYECLQRNMRESDKSIFIDEIEFFLNAMIPCHKISGFSMTNNEKSNIKHKSKYEILNDK